jgi:hypothetical protein
MPNTFTQKLCARSIIPNSPFLPDYSLREAELNSTKSSADDSMPFKTMTTGSQVFAP